MASLLTKFVGNIKDNIDSVDKEAKAFDTSTVAPTGDVFADATIGSRQTEDIVKTTDEGTFTDVTTFQKFTDGLSHIEASGSFLAPTISPFSL